MRNSTFFGFLIAALVLATITFSIYPDTATASLDYQVTLPLIMRARPTRFAVIGDYGFAGQPEADVAALVRSWDPEFIVTTGDNNYPDGLAETINANISQYYGAYILSSRTGDSQENSGGETNRFYPALGNHDWKAITCSESYCTGPYFDYFQLPGNERYYDVVWGQVHIFMLNSMQQEPQGNQRYSSQAAWLQAQLATSDSPWDIVVFHHSPYASGIEHGSSEVMQWPFEEWGAEAVISGHEHYYERLTVDGIPYFINGLGGYSIYDFGTPLPQSQVRYNQDYGAMLVEATASTITYRFFSRAGELIDKFTQRS
jgi:hypothetical protein